MDLRKISEQVYGLSNSDHPLSPLVKEALGVIDECLDTHGAEGTSISFNGGKDCTVLLHLYAGALVRRRPPGEEIKPIHAVYIPVPSPFPDLEQFIDDTARDYNLDLFSCRPSNPYVESVSASTVPTLSTIKSSDSSYSAPQAVGKSKGGEGMRKALELYKKCFPRISAILIGTRRTDPHGAQLSHRNMTDAGWPEYERVNPIINWSYGDIWTFLRHLNVPYCKLYDQGYTSLGSTYNTFQNPALLISEPEDALDIPSHEISRASSSIGGRSSASNDMSTNGHISSMNGDTKYPHTYGISIHTSTGCSQRPTNGASNAIKHHKPAIRYLPAYELKDGNLERCGRGTALVVQERQLS